MLPELSRHKHPKRQVISVDNGEKHFAVTKTTNWTNLQNTFSNTKYFNISMAYHKSEFWFWFLIVKIEENSGDLVILRRLSLSERYFLNISVLDSGGFKADTLIIASVQDVNDHSPVFSKDFYEFRIPEGQFAICEKNEFAFLLTFLWVIIVKLKTKCCSFFIEQCCNYVFRHIFRHGFMDFLQCFSNIYRRFDYIIITFTGFLTML